MYKTTREAALALANGETINRVDLPKDIDLLVLHLKQVQHNCNRVIKQLEEIE